MNVEAIRGIARGFSNAQTQLQGVLKGVDQLVAQCDTSWRGPDSRQFHQRWQSGSRTQVLASIQALKDAVSTLERNAAAQQQTSATLEGGGAGSGGSSAGGGGTVGGGSGGGGGGVWGGALAGAAAAGAVKTNEKDGHYTAKKADAFGKGSKPTGIIKGKAGEGNWGSHAAEDKDGKAVGKPKHGLDPRFTAASGSFFLWGAQAKAEDSFKRGPMSGGGTAKARAGVYGDGSVFATKNGVGVEGSVTGGAEASAQGHLDAGKWAGVDGKASAMVGGKLDGTARIDFGHEGDYGVEGKVGAFAGAKVEGNAGAQVAGVKTSVTGEAWVGVGAEATGTAEYKDGHFTLGLSAGAGYGVGAKAGFKIDVDVPKTVSCVKDAASGVAHFFGF